MESLLWEMTPIWKKIEKVWFEENKIFIETNKNKKYSIPLEVFPTLKDASAEERSDFYIWDEAQSIRWECLDEDIHISSFFKEHKLNLQNPVAKLFSEFPQLNVAEVANMIGIHKNLLAQYIYGVKTPSDKMMQDIKDALHLIGRKLLAIQ